MPSTYWSGKTIIVTGGMGFIGSHFVQELLAAGAEVICLYRTYKEGPLDHLLGHPQLRLVQVNLLDQTQLQAICKYAARRIDGIFHCAALDGNTQFKLQHAARILDSNLQITSNILNCGRDNEIDNLVLLSSAEIYSPQAASPIAEEDDYKKQLGYTENGYVLSKTFSEVMAELYRKQFGMSIYVPRPTNVYGPRDNFNETTGRVIPSMMKKIATNKEIEIWGDGSQTRSFIYVTDLVNAVLQMVEKKEHHTLNIATRESISILELARLLSQGFGTTKQIRLDPSKPIGVQNRKLDVRKLYGIIDFTPRSLKDGLRETIEWYTGQLKSEPKLANKKGGIA